MDVKPLHNEQDYDWGIRGVARYFEASILQALTHSLFNKSDCADVSGIPSSPPLPLVNLPLCQTIGGWQYTETIRPVEKKRAAARCFQSASGFWKP